MSRSSGVFNESVFGQGPGEEPRHQMTPRGKVLILEDKISTLSALSVETGKSHPFLLAMASFYVFSFFLLVIGAAFLVYVLCFNGRHVLRSLNARPCKDKKVIGLVEEICRQNNVTISAIFVYSGAANAFIFGYPTKLVISKDLIAGLSRNELRAILSHEISHKKNWDLILKPIWLGIRIALFYNPLVHVVYHQVVKDQELLADTSFLKTREQKMSFMSALIKVSERNRAQRSDPTSINRSLQTYLKNKGSPDISERYKNLFEGS